jgi:hypothetical protein
MNKLAVAFSMLLMATPVLAHQPVMDMAPRWEDGYGIQVRHVSRYSDKLIEKNNDLVNPNGLKRIKRTTWLEGVYTFDRAKRITVKVPWVEQYRTTLIGAQVTRQKDKGLGDIIIGVPLKLYENKSKSTQNFGFTPSIRIPTGKTSGDYPIADGSTGLGLSFSYSTEDPKWYQMYDLFYWINTEGTRDQKPGNELGLDINWGYHPYHNNDTNSGMFIMSDITARYKEEGSTISGNNAGARVSAGPVLVLYRGNVMFRAEYSIPVWEYALDQTVSYGQELNVGIGITF